MPVSALLSLRAFRRSEFSKCLRTYRWIRESSSTTVSSGKKKYLNTFDIDFRQEKNHVDQPHEPDPTAGKFVTFRQMIGKRREEAKRSLLIQVKSMKSAEDLFLYCSKNIGKVKRMYYHLNKGNEKFPNFYLVEFEDRKSTEHAYELSQHRRDSVQLINVVPVYSPFLWFASDVSSRSLLRNAPGMESLPESASSDVPVYIPVEFEDNLHDDDKIEKLIRKKKTLDGQIHEFYNLTKMSNLSSRIRFLACEQIELAISGMFPKAEVLPFGSSVNTFGKHTSDLDMVLTLDQKEELGEEKDTNSLSRLFFHTKGVSSSQRKLIAQRNCDQFSSMIKAFLPGCQGVLNISHARVPIIKYRQEFLNLECDLSFSSKSGHFMSELLYIYGELDPRVRPLVFVVRKWAKSQGLIEAIRPTTLFTNFSLTLLVIFFLQNSRYKILPPFQRLQKMAKSHDRRICDDGVDCTFVRDLSGYQKHLNALFDSPESPNVSELLLSFFEFYASFPFSRNAVCILTGSPQPSRGVELKNRVVRNNRFFIDIINPLEPNLNVSCNVNEEALSLFQTLCENSVTTLKNMLENETLASDDANLNLFQLFRCHRKFAKFAIRKSLELSLRSLKPSSEENNETAKEMNSSEKKQSEYAEKKRLEKVKMLSRVINPKLK